MLSHRVQRGASAVPFQVVLFLLCGCPQLLDDDFEVPRRSLDGVTPPGGNGNVVTPGDDAGQQQPSVVHDAASADGAVEEEPTQGPAPSSIAAALRSALKHRYRFEGGTASVLDSVGTAHGISVGAEQVGGAAVLAGGGEFVDLPNGLISGLRNATLEAWVIWEVDPAASTSSWQRIFDFGNNSSPIEGQQGDDAHGLYVSPKSGGTLGKLHLEFDANGNINVDGPDALPAGVQVQVVAVMDDDADILAVYQDGQLEGALAFPGSLASINDWNNWLGRSQFAGDPSFKGKILDYRIYAAALSAEQIQASFVAGPDADW